MDAERMLEVGLLTVSLPGAEVILADGRIEVDTGALTATWFPGSGLPLVLRAPSGRLLECIALAGEDAQGVADVIAAIGRWRAERGL